MRTFIQKVSSYVLLMYISCVRLSMYMYRHIHMSKYLSFSKTSYRFLELEKAKDSKVVKC